MTDTNITLTGAAAWTSGPLTVTASASLFTSDDVGRLLAMKVQAGFRAASTAYAVGAIFYGQYAGVDRLYRVTKAGTTHAVALAGTVPDYDLFSPRDATAGVVDGTATLLYLGQGQYAWAWGTITAVADATHCTVDFSPKGTLASVNATQLWKLGEFSDVRGWPRAGMFHKARQWLAGSIAKPQSFWSSETGDYPSFSSSEPDGTVLDTNAITETMDDDQLNTALWMVPMGRRGLAIGTASGEWTVTPATTNAPLSPANVEALPQSDRGSSEDVPGIRVGSVVLFVEKGGRKLREFNYDFGSDAFQTPDLTVLSEHITGTGIVDAAYQRRPSGTLWMVREDGALITLTYDREQKIRAWCRHVLGGTDAVAESVCCVPSPDGKTDDVYLTVSRTIGGSTVRTIEYIRPPFRAAIEGAAAGFFVDAGLTYTGSPVTAVGGLEHLEGEVVWICADGSARQNQQVLTGKVFVTGPAASVIHVGLPYTYRIITLPPERGAGAAQGSAQGRQQRTDHVTLRLFESGRGAIGQPGGVKDALVFREVGDPIGEAVPLFTGDKRVPHPGGWDRGGQIEIVQQAPLPFTVLAIMQERTTNG